MKIGIFTDSYRPYTSGVVRSIETFSKELTEMGHEIYIFAPSYPKYKNERDGSVFRFVSIPTPTNSDFALALPFSLRLRRVVRRLNLDIIHVQSPFLLGALGARCARRLGIPLVFTFHTMYEKYVHYVPFAQTITSEITRTVCREFSNKCNMVIVPTMIVKEYLNEIGVRSPIRSVPTGIDIDIYSKGDPNWLREKFNIDPDKKVLIFVGRLGQEKNVNFLLKSFADIAKTNPDTILVLVGEGPERKDLEHESELMGIRGRLIFTGTLSKEEVASAYCGSDIFVFASVTETQGLVVGEAKAAGLPVVAVRAYGVSEMVEDKVDGFLTELTQSEFTGKINLLLNNDELRAAMSKNARKNAEKLSSRNAALRLLEIYNESIQNKASKEPYLAYKK